MSVPDHEQGGDPACWAHEFADIVESEVVASDVVDLSNIDGVGGAVWSLAHGGDLDANLVRLAPGAEIGAHVNSEVDVLILVRGGDGEIAIDDAVHMLGGSAVALVPKGARRSIRAGDRGLEYLSVHRKRGPLGIRSTA